MAALGLFLLLRSDASPGVSPSKNHVSTPHLRRDRRIAAVATFCDLHPSCYVLQIDIGMFSLCLSFAPQMPQVPQNTFISAAFKETVRGAGIVTVDHDLLVASTVCSAKQPKGFGGGWFRCRG